MTEVKLFYMVQSFSIKIRNNVAIILRNAAFQINYDRLKNKKEGKWQHKKGQKKDVTRSSVRVQVETVVPTQDLCIEISRVMSKS